MAEILKFSTHEKVAIVTPAFNNLNEGFSLVGIVKDQVKMLQRYNHDVDVIVSETFSGDEKGLPLRKIMPRGRLIDYRTVADFGNLHPEDFTQEDVDFHRSMPDKVETFFKEISRDYDVVLTHDIVFTGWNLPYYLGLKQAQPNLDPDCRWAHWLHSNPTHEFDWWNLGDLGNRHKLVIPNMCYRQMAAENFHTTWEGVRTIPHIRDIRDIHRFIPETREFIDRYPQVLQADIVQVYPASTDRLDAKRLREVILIFKELKWTGATVCLVCANQWATGTQPKQDAMEYKELALRNGLGTSEFIFTSDFKKEYEVGIPHEMLMDLLKLSNLFIFPTISESYGLCLAEACLAGGVLPVLNKSLDVSIEITGGKGLSFPFGSFDKAVNHGEGGEAGFIRAVALHIYSRMHQELCLGAKSNFRQDNNMDSIYRQWYAPLFKESLKW